MVGRTYRPRGVSGTVSGFQLHDGFPFPRAVFGRRVEVVHSPGERRNLQCAEPPRAVLWAGYRPRHGKHPPVVVAVVVVVVVADYDKRVPHERCSLTMGRW